MGLLLFSLIIFFTYKLQVVKLLLILVLILPSLGKKYYLSKKISKWVGVLVGLELFAILVAVINGNPEPFVSFRVMVLWPILYLFLIRIISFEFWEKLDVFISYALLLLIVIGFFSCVRFNLLGAFDSKFLNFESIVRPDYPIISIGGGGVVIFMIVYFYVFPKWLLGLSKVPKIDMLNSILGVLFVLMTSRRALILNIGLVFVIIALLFLFSSGKLKKEKMHFSKYLPFLVVIVVIGAGYLIQQSLLDLDFMHEFVKSAFETEEDGDRKMQATALINGWLESPIWGNGVGVNASVARSNIPGAYELTYLAMLFAKGIIGFVGFWILVIRLVGWSFRIALSDTKYRTGLCVIVSLVMFLIANASNPYLGSFDFLWVLFWPLLFVNMYEKEKRLSR